jgi:hypothetical protein
MEDRDPTTPFIAAVLAERDKRAEEGDISPFPKLRLQPDMPPPDYRMIPGYAGAAGAELYDLDTGADLSNPRIQDLDDHEPGCHCGPCCDRAGRVFSGMDDQ